MIRDAFRNQTALRRIRKNLKMITTKYIYCIDKGEEEEDEEEEMTMIIVIIFV
jgi:hypothetical protein